MSAYRPCAAKPPVPHYSYPSGLLLIPQCSAVRIAPPAKQDAAAKRGGGVFISHRQQPRPATATGSRGRAGGASPRPGGYRRSFGGEGAGALTCCCRATCSRSLEACFRMASIGRRPLRRRGRSRGGRRRAEERSESGRREGGSTEEVASGSRSPAPALLCSLSLSPFPVWPCLIHLRNPSAHKSRKKNYIHEILNEIYL